MPAGKHSSGKRAQAGGKGEGLLNENQARRLRVTCQHIDRTLCEIESVLCEPASATAFPSYIDDLSPAQKELITESAAKIRARLVETLERQSVDPGKPGVPVSRAVRGRMYIIDIAAEEIRSRRMKGYGNVSPDVMDELECFADEMQGLADQVTRALQE
jgi:hypothetical protein